MRLTVTQDLAAGLLFAVIGGAGLWYARDLSIGSPLRMGSGYLPILLSWMLIAMGVIIIIKGFVVGSAAVARFHIRPAVCISAAVLAFAFLIDRAGLIAATVAGVTIGAFAGHEFRLREALLLSAGLASFFAVLFVYVLGLPIKILPI